MYTVANLYLMNLAIADIFVLAICYPLTIIRNETSWPFGAVLCKILPALSDCFYGVSMGCITAISIYRYRMILHSMSTHMTFLHAKVSMLVVWVIALAIISAPLCWVLVLVSNKRSQPIVSTNDTSSLANSTSSTDLATNFSYPLLTTISTLLSANETSTPVLPRQPKQREILYKCISSWPSDKFRKTYQIIQITWYLLPLSVILFTYLRIRRYLKKTLKYEWVTAGGMNNLKQSGLTGRVLGIKRALTLLAPVVVTFAVLMFPWNLLRLLSIVMDIKKIPYIVTFLEVAGVMMIANSCSNPFIYYIMSKEFRDEFRKQFKTITRCYKMSRDDSFRFTSVSRTQSCRSQTRVETVSAVDDRADGSINGFNNSWEKYAARVPESPLIRTAAKRDTSKLSVRFPNDLPTDDESEKLIMPQPDPDRETYI